jgi:hypothetical protein
MANSNCTGSSLHIVACRLNQVMRKKVLDGTTFKIKLNKRTFGHGDIITYDKYNGLELVHYC